MSVLSVQNLQETLVGKNIARTANVQITDPSASAYIADGEVVVLNSTGAPMTTSTTNTYAASPWIQIVQRNGDNLVFSGKISGDKVTAYRGKAGATGQEQIYHIGYNGTSGSLDITSGLDFQLTVIENQDDMMWSEQKKKNVVYVPNNLVTSQLDLAKAIVKNQMKKYTTDGSAITACMLNSGTSTVLTGASTVAVTHGSDVIVPSAAITNSGFGAGSIVRIGVTGTAINSSDKVACPVYTVKAAHPTIANAWILDMPYAGPSNSALSVNDTGYIATAGTSWGVRFTGKALPYRRDFFKFKRVGFTLQMSGFGATVLSKTQDSTYGSGDGRLVLEEESFSKGFEGALNRMTVPLPLANETFTADASTASTINLTYHDAFVNATLYYDCITIEHYGQDFATVVGTPRMPQLIKIFMYDTAAGGAGAAQGKTDNTTKAVQPALNTWMASVPGAFANLTAFV
jgi:hypothetical protein